MEEGHKKKGINKKEVMGEGEQIAVIVLLVVLVLLAREIRKWD